MDKLKYMMHLKNKYILNIEKINDLMFIMSINHDPYINDEIKQLQIQNNIYCDVYDYTRRQLMRNIAEYNKYEQVDIKNNANKKIEEL